MRNNTLARRLTLTCAAGALLWGSTASAQAYNGRKWSTTTRTVTTSYTFYDAEKAALMRGMLTWNNVAANFDWVDGGFSGYSPGDAATPACDTQSGIDDSPSVTGLTLASMRQCSSSAAPGLFTDIDLLVNQETLFADGFYTGTSTPPSTQVDMQSMSVHEFGHGLGLAHDSYSTSVVMYPSISNGVVRRTLHSRDQTGMKTLYPVP
jgi:hypothetical protein